MIGNIYPRSTLFFSECGRLGQRRDPVPAVQGQKQGRIPGQEGAPGIQYRGRIHRQEGAPGIQYRERIPRQEVAPGIQYIERIPHASSEGYSSRRYSTNQTTYSCPGPGSMY